MPDFLFIAASYAVSNFIQLIAGCIIAACVYAVFRRRAPAPGDISSKRLSLSLALASAAFSFCGIILPLGIYGVIPVIAGLLALGLNSDTVFSLLVSNVLFNMLVPLRDPAFIWRTGWRQAVFAFLAGMIAGILLLMRKSPVSGLLRLKNIPSIKSGQSIIRVFLSYTDDCIKKLGLYLLAGVILDLVFQRYILGSIIRAIYTNSVTAAIPVFFGSHDVSNPYFLMTFTIMYMLMNLVNLSALSAIFKFKGLLHYFGYYLLLAAILSVSAFV